VPVSRKILIIDDSNFIRIQIKHILSKYKVDVFELNNANDFFTAAWQNRALDLLILDINLPGINGLTALEMMRQDTNLAYIPVIILSGNSDAGTVQKALKLGAINYVRKPFSQEDLLERIEQVLGPLVLPEADLNTDVQAHIHHEISRAKRGDTAISFIQLQLPLETRALANIKDLTIIKEHLTTLLRETDSVLVTEKRDILLILPFTEGDGINVVIERIKRLFHTDDMQSMHIESTKLATATFPSDGPDEQTILKLLEARIPHGDLIGKVSS